eukprot:COSAG06_NODE_961_length_11312_cov_10.559351_7_plen_500_part_00
MVQGPNLRSNRIIHDAEYGWHSHFDGDEYPHVGQQLPAWVKQAAAQGFMLSSELMFMDCGMLGLVTVATATVKADVQQPTGALININGEDARLRSVLLVKPKDQYSGQFSALAQSLPVESCVTTCSKATDDKCTFTVAAHLYPLHWAAGMALIFDSRTKGQYQWRDPEDHPGTDPYRIRPNDTGDLRIKENNMLHSSLTAARRKNALQDAKTAGKIVQGANWAIVSFPGEEHDLWGMIVAAPRQAVTRTFDEHGLTLGCVWTDKPGDAWWDMWTRNCIDAYNAGQTLLVYSRRAWAERTEPYNVSVPGEKNLSWPGKAINFKKGEPIEKYGVAQGRETEWLRKMIETGEEWDGQLVQFDSDRVQYKPVEELDEIRAIDAEGNRWEGGWSAKGPDGPGTMVYADGSKGEGLWVDGVGPDNVQRLLKVTTFFGAWTVHSLNTVGSKGTVGFETTQYGHTKLKMDQVGVLLGDYEGSTDKNGRRDGKGTLTYTNPNGGVASW